MAQTALDIPSASADAVHEDSAGRRERAELYARFEDRLRVRHDLNRRLVSYQGNKAQPGLRWFKYKEGFSAGLVREALAASRGPVLDPFAGLGTTVLVASGAGRPATGIEIMPVGARAARAIAAVGNGADFEALRRAGEGLLQAVGRKGEADASYRFPHVPITARAFSAETESAIAKARAFLASVEDADVRMILDVACMSVLEEVSYTRKDGQYLRWDSRSGRALRGHMHKGPVPAFADALARRLHEVKEDVPHVGAHFGGCRPRIVEGSALAELPRLAAQTIGLTITSPPYANRYDYTRTYALELAWLGYDRAAFGALRQALISATVENRPKGLCRDGERQRPVPRRGSARRSDPLRHRRAMRLRVRGDRRSAVWQRQREPTDGTLRPPRDPQVRLPLAPLRTWIGLRHRAS